MNGAANEGTNGASERPENGLAPDLGGQLQLPPGSFLYVDQILPT